MSRTPVSYEDQRGLDFIKMFRFVHKAGEGGFPHAAFLSEKELGASHRVSLALRSAATVGTLADASTSALGVVQNMADELRPLLRPMLVLGRMLGVRTVPLNVSMANVTSGASVAWIPENGVIPMSPMGLDLTTLAPLKCAGIVPVTNQLIRMSNPRADRVIRDDLLAAVAEHLDRTFCDPTVAAVVGQQPGSPWNGATSISASGTTSVAARNDFSELFSAVGEMRNPYLVMSKRTANALQALGDFSDYFSHVTATGGYIGQAVVLTSAVLPAADSPDTGIIGLIDASALSYGDDVPFEVEMARHADLQLTSTPDSPSNASTVLSPGWQRDLSSIRVIARANWAMRRNDAAAFITNAGSYHP